jgi:hypothetical protein
MNLQKHDALKAAVILAKNLLQTAKDYLDAFEALAENNVYPNLKDANNKVENKLRYQASEDCEGSYNCGQESYTQDFMVDGIKYTGLLECEYNRHDKTYYYVEGASYSYKPA